MCLYLRSAMQPTLCKGSANEGQESLLSIARMQPILCKGSANTAKIKTFSHTLLLSAAAKGYSCGKVDVYAHDIEASACSCFFTKVFLEVGLFHGVK